MASSKWERIGHGGYNTIYRSRKGRKADGSGGVVFKVQILGDDVADLPVTDIPERSVRLWNEINPDLNPPAEEVTEIIDGQLRKGWTCPYIMGVQASDDEISVTVIDLFNRTGRIVVDATSAKNFIKTPSGKIVCIDVGMALELEKREEGVFKGRARRNSEVSLTTWRDLESDYAVYFETFNKPRKYYYPQTIATVKALLFIKENRPDILNAGFLDNDLIKQLATSYDRQFRKEPGCEEDVKISLALLEKKREITLYNVKDSCREMMWRYINSRGSIDDNEQFKPSLVTRFFRDKNLTHSKVETARYLIDEIDDVESLEQLEEVLFKVLDNPDTIKSKFTSSLATSLGKCLLMVDCAKENYVPLTKQAPSPF